MPIHHSIWRVAKPPSRLSETTLSSEQLLEDMIVASRWNVNLDRAEARAHAA